MTKNKFYLFFLLGFGLIAYQLGAKYFNQVYSLELDTVSVTISNSRPSFRGGLNGAHSSGVSILTIDGTQNAFASTSSAQLMQGDTVTVGTAGTMEVDIVVASTSSLTTINLTTALASGKLDNDEVISTQSADLTVRFKTNSAITDGKFRILVPAFADDNLDSDGIPDAGFFDAGGATAATITAPASPPAGYTFDACTVSRTTLNSLDYHTFTCPYTGAGAVDSDFGTANSAYFVINDLINPAPKTSHTTGTADTYSVIVQHLDGSDNVMDYTTTKIGVIEAVKVSATVDPSISFRIIGVNSGSSVCGNTTDVTTTPASVPFGILDIANFVDAAQALSVTTNAVSGYVVTTIENDQLGRNGGTCTGDNQGTTCIRDSGGDTSTMSHTVTDEWVSTNSKGFAYSLHDSNSTTTEAFAYTSTDNGCDGVFCAKQFADAENTQAAQTIFSDSGPSDNDNLYVCYRIIPDVTTAAGYYENYITYTATGTF